MVHDGPVSVSKLYHVPYCLILQRSGVYYQHRVDCHTALGIGHGIADDIPNLIKVQVDQRLPSACQLLHITGKSCPVCP